jgi:hypothetical protein
VSPKLLIAVLSLALSACYASDALLLNPSEPAHPIEEGTYARAGADQDQVRVNLDPDGWYRIEQIQAGGLIGESHRVLLNPLTLDGGREGFAAVQEGDDGYDYAVGFVDHGRVYLATPDCVDPLDRADAVDHGGFADDDDPMTHKCLFRNRPALLSALAVFAGHAEFGAPYQKK